MAPSPTLAAAAAALLIAASTSEAFVAPSSSSRSQVGGGSSSGANAAAFGLPTASSAVVVARPSRVAFALGAEEGESSSSSAEAAAEEPAAEAESAEAESAEGEGEGEGEGEKEEDEAEPEEPPKEDPEVTAIKEEIAELEAKIKSKQSSLDQIRDSSDTYTEAGYMRKVAEMDQIRKTRGAAFKSNEFTARANIVQQFLPVLDELKSIDAKYADEDFAKSYSGLLGSFSSALSALGAVEFTAEVGGAVNMLRHEVEREEYSDDYAKGTVIEPIAVGMEIEGNVMRRAKVAASLGSEEEARKAEEEAKKAEEEAAAKAKAEAEAEGEAEAESEGEGEAAAE